MFLSTAASTPVGDELNKERPLPCDPLPFFGSVAEGAALLGPGEAVAFAGAFFTAPVGLLAGTAFGVLAKGEFVFTSGAGAFAGVFTIDLASDAADSSICSSIIGGITAGRGAAGFAAGKGDAPSYPQSSA